MAILFQSEFGEEDWGSERIRAEQEPILGFSDVDKVGTFQPHDDALMVIFWIGRFDVRRVMVDQGSEAEIMYPDLYKGQKLKPEDLSKYNSPLVGFDGRTVIHKGMIKLLV